MHDVTFVRLRQLQFVQTVPGDATLYVVPGAGFNDNDVASIRRALGATMNGMIEFRINTCEARRQEHSRRSKNRTLRSTRRLEAGSTHRKRLQAVAPRRHGTLATLRGVISCPVGIS